MIAKPIGPQVRIRELRNAYGLSVKQLVERLGEAGMPGVHEDTIRNVELGHRRASRPLMTAWAKALGISPLDVWQPTPDEGEQRGEVA
ncbi:helix-turn-helix transcriptional regulator [Nocardia cyriacigeorgica]|uniref:Helix-turn-helix transcriptional regulator n=1 Tax=Nocardia cyriacigeorgica TaxID=135487 RepID=A0ABX0CD32_9NOCA|nr:helix-turn-helix transcriptional regulator [Nocardia cyriacigeorgica]NEW42770.1 helix-turn-helix transcriptional regulator [Nocardia cyriacigeorgica]NEW53935.1 helix-turn-helix transcriptional regulator [Nocardia cyriacigeorgica]NEW54476.1 helix-turn-helix transcriptional regulator [Nocardia cyriacigeorgica]